MRKWLIWILYKFPCMFWESRMNISSFSSCPSTSFLFSRCFPLAAFLRKCVSNKNPFYVPLFSFLLPLVILVDIQFRIIFSQGFWQWVCLSFVRITWEFVQSLFTRSFSYRCSIWVLRRKKWSIYEGKTNFHLPLER